MSRKLDGLLKRMARVDIGDKNSLEAIDDMTEAAAALRAQQERIDALEAWIANPPKHRYWRPGEPDCPKDIKGGNGELHTLRCKVCGLDDPREDICRATLTGEKQS